MNTVFFGSSKFVIPILDVLRKNFDLSLVITTEKLPTESVPNYCIKNKIQYISIQKFNNEIIEQLNNINSPIAVLAYFGLILPNNVLDIFPKGIINIHPSLLPKYRGPTPGQSAIISGDDKTGVTIIKLDAEVDHGPILNQKEEKILPTDTAETLYDRLFNIGANLLPKVLQLYLDGKITLKEQNHNLASFTPHLSRTDGYIDVTNPPAAEKLDRMIRAYYPWPGVWTRLKINDERLKIVKFLPNKMVQVEGKKPMSYKDFVNGYPNAKEIMQLLSRE